MFHSYSKIFILCISFPSDEINKSMNYVMTSKQRSHDPSENIWLFENKKCRKRKKEKMMKRRKHDPAEGGPRRLCSLDTVNPGLGLSHHDGEMTERCLQELYEGLEFNLKTRMGSAQVLLQFKPGETTEDNCDRKSPTFVSEEEEVVSFRLKPLVDCLRPKL